LVELLGAAVAPLGPGGAGTRGPDGGKEHAADAG
jgi:hypothetical protein